MKSIKYLSYYAKPDNSENRAYMPAANNKIEYICYALNKCGYYAEILSASRTIDEKHCFKGTVSKLNDMQSLKYFFSFPAGNILKRILRTITSFCSVFFELMKLKKGEKIIVYHSLGFMTAVKLAHRIKKFYLILEVEEIYSDVTGLKKSKEKELHFLQSADSYIFPTELLNHAVNKYNRPYAIIYGTYKVEAEREKLFNDGKIHIVYAGTFDPRKGGALAAVASAEFLPENYHIHILGFGSDEQINNVKEAAFKTAKKSKSEVTYDGLLSGEEYIRFIQSCNIGLSTQNPDADFNATSFPSKILSYMANGLRVVSIRIPAIETSAIGEYMYYYDEQTPKNIADAIYKIKIDAAYDSRELINHLATEFEINLQTLLK